MDSSLIEPKTMGEAIVAGDKSGALPALNRDETVEGPDDDSNGIRDDIEAYISGLPDAPEQKAALLQAATAIQKSLTVDTTDQISRLAASRQIARASACAFARYDRDAAREKTLDIEKVTINTKIRFAAYEAFNQALSGTTVLSPQDDGCADGASARPAALAATGSASLCLAPGYTVAFFNGVWNSHAQAVAGMEALRHLHGDIFRGESVQYELFYNHTGCGPGVGGAVSCLEDVAEVFEQRAREIDASGRLAERWEFFWESLAGGGPLTARIEQIFPNAVNLFSSLYTDIAARIATGFSYLLSNPSTEADYAIHNTRLDALALQHQKLLLVAHSQGNLFVNHAYDHIRSKISAASVKVVHIAPASATLRGDYILADIDLVINALRIQGVSTVPDINISLPASLSDVSGHTLIGTYLDPARAALPAIEAMLTEAMTPLVTPGGNGNVGSFTVTLTWDGPGDVDLHAFEPSGAHVFYGNRAGTAGFLDVDNVVANGPEHYYAACDPTKLAPGLYRIGINNFARATGRYATVQISTSREGTIFTLLAGVGAERGTSGNASPIPAFTVAVTKDAATGQFSFAVR